MFTTNQITKLKKDADETLKNVDMTKYNKNMFTLIGASLAIQNMENNSTNEIIEEQPAKKKTFDSYFMDAMKAFKEAMSLYDICQKMAYTVDDQNKLKTFREYLLIVAQKEGI